MSMPDAMWTYYGPPPDGGAAIARENARSLSGSPRVAVMSSVMKPTQLPAHHLTRTTDDRY